MNPETKSKWLAALRGESEKQYKQGKLTLRPTPDEYCCLGVLCDVVDPNGWFNNEHGDIRHHAWDDNNKLSDSFGGLEVAAKLGSMNDNGKTFAQIADYIEKRIS